MAMRTFLPLFACSCSLALVACTARTPDQDTPQACTVADTRDGDVGRTASMLSQFVQTLYDVCAAHRREQQ